jgi:hypothetical protein
VLTVRIAEGVTSYRQQSHGCHVEATAYIFCSTVALAFSSLHVAGLFMFLLKQLLQIVFYVFAEIDALNRVPS